MNDLSASVFATDRGPPGDKSRPCHLKQFCDKSKRNLDVNAGNSLASSSQNARASTSYEEKEVAATEVSSAIEMVRARHKGRVGTYIREGNVSLASFGIKVKRDKKGKKLISPSRCLRCFLTLF